MRRLLYCFVICIITSLCANAQRSLWFTTEHISSNRLQDICEDKYGFIWIATENGLNRYDGYSFFSFFHSDEDSMSLLSNYVRTLYLDNNGLLWVGTNKGLQYQLPGDKDFHTVKLSDNRTPFISRILKLRDGQIWFITSGRGVYSIQSDNLDYAQNLEKIGSAVGTSVFRAIMEDRSGKVWFGTPMGVYIYDPSDMNVVPFNRDIINNDVTDIHEDSSGDVFISTSFHLYVWHSRINKLERLTPENGIGEITHSFIDDNGNLYVSIRGNGIRRYNKKHKTLEMVNHRHETMNLDRLDISAFFRDRQGNTWLGCFLNGVMMIVNDDDQFKFLKFSDYNEDISGTVTALLIDNDENIWIGYNNRGVSCIDRHKRIVVDNHDNLFVNCLYQDSSGEIWAGLIRGGLAKIDKQSGNISIVVPNRFASVYSIVEDKQGRIYYSELGQGFSRYDKEKGTTERWSTTTRTEDGKHLNSDWIYDMYIDESNNLWIGHDFGMNCFDIDANTFVDIPVLSSTLVNTACSIIKEYDNRFWLGTNKGLMMYDKTTGRYRHYFISDGLSDETICGIEEDREGNIWVSTLLGLNKVSPQTEKINRYYTGNGLVDRSYNKVSAVNTNKGVVYFGSNLGITYFRPEDINKKVAVNDVRLTGVYLNNVLVTGNSMSGSKPIVKNNMVNANDFWLSYVDNSFTLAFSTLNFGDQDCISYEYTFDQGSNSWSETPVGVNRINFIHLSSGRHLLSVRARMNDNLSGISTFSFQIGYPWYLSVYAYIVYFLFLAGITYSLIGFSRRKRARVLSEAQLQSFTNVAHEICTPMTMIISPLEDLLLDDTQNDNTIRQLRQMKKSSIKILTLINQLLDITKYEEGQMHLQYARTEMVSFVMGQFELFTQTAESRNITFRFSNESDEIFSWIDRDSIDKVMMNLLSNAFKYTLDGGTVDVNIRSSVDDRAIGPLRQYVEVSVKDTGVGLEMKDVNQLFERFYRVKTELTSVTLGMGIGLNYARILIGMHQGIIKAVNRRDCKGSIFYFRLPLGNKHIRPEDIVEVTDDIAYDVSEAPPEESDAMLAQKIKVSTNKKILVIDDNETMLEYIRENLQPLYRVYVCRNGKEGLSKALTILPDLVITDVIMPEMDGITLVKKLKKNSIVSHIPVIMLSGRSKLQDRMSGHKNGADYYLPKPFYMNELKAIVSSLINNRLIVKGKYTGLRDQEGNIRNISLKSAEDVLIQKIIDIISGNISNSEFDIETICTEIGLSRSKLHRLIKDKTGYSTGKYIQSIRMQYAAKLLKDNNANINEIANAVGYDSHNHFSTVFKEYFGVSPMEYSRQPDSNK